MVQNKRNKLSSDTWLEIRNVYVQGIENTRGERSYPSLESLAKKHKIHWNTIHRRSKVEEWKDQRAIFEAKIVNDVDDRKRKEIMKQAVQFDFDSLRLARSLQATIANTLTIDNDKARQQRERNLLPEKQRQQLDFTQPIYTLKSSEINSLAMALEKAQKVGRLAFGESTENATITNVREQTEEELQRTYRILQDFFPRASSSTDQIH